MPLTDKAIRALVQEEKVYTMTDGQGLILEVRPNGSKLWIIRYWIGGKEKRTSLGKYPEVTLKEARDRNIDFRRALRSGKPLGIDSETFSTVAAEWMEKRMNTKSESYLRTIRLRLDRLIFPFIGHMKITDITPGIVLQLCRRIEEKGTVETASRVKMIIGQIFNYAIATSRTDINPTLALRGALQTRPVKHYATITAPDKIATLMRQIDSYPFSVVRCALKLSALTFLRPGELRQGEWTEISFDSREWLLPERKMKMKREHVVPLATQTLNVLEELKGITGSHRWLFPSARRDGRCMSDGALRVALRSMGYANDEMTPHGFRSMASTILNESGLFSPDVIERQLAHAERNSVRAAYNRAEYLPQRREMMQWWADWLDRHARK